MANIATALPGFNDPWRLVISFFFFWWIIFYTVFYVLAKRKKKKIYRLEVWVFFSKMDHRISFVLAFRLPARRFQMPLEGLSF